MNPDEMPSEVAERALLASLLMSADELSEVRELVTPQSFQIQAHRDVFGSMVRIADSGGTPDVVTITDDLGDDDMLMVADLMTATFTPYMAVEYAKRVHHHARRATIQRMLSDLFAELHTNPDADPVELVNAALVKINDLTVTDAGPQLYESVVEQLQQRLTDQQAGLWEDTVLSTGLHSLDGAITGGFRPAESIIVAARPGMGKTAWALQLMHNVARRKSPVLMFSAEMSMMSLVERGLSEVSGVEADVLRRKTLGQGDYDRLMRAADQMAKMPVAIDDTSAIKTAKMLSRAQRFQRKHGLSMVVFDYMELAGDATREGEQMRISTISHAMKAMAKTLDVPVVTLSQLSRKVEDRDPPIPRMSDLRMSGAIEQDADKILFLYRPDYYVEQGILERDEATEGTVQVIIGKQRNGMTGNVSLRFDGSTMRFMDLDEAPSAQYDMRTFT